MRITRFHPAPDGGSVFAEIEIALPFDRTDAEGHVIVGSRRFASPAVQLVELPAGLDQSWHPAPQRQIVVVLDGTLEVTTGDGATRRFGPGNAFLADDVASRGHLTRTIDGAVRVLFVPMPAEVDLDTWIAPT